MTAKYVVVVTYTDRDPGEVNAYTMLSARRQARDLLAFPTANRVAVYRDADYGVRDVAPRFELRK